MGISEQTYILEQHLGMIGDGNSKTRNIYFALWAIRVGVFFFFIFKLL
jgi:hypothetical protein